MNYSIKIILETYQFDVIVKSIKICLLIKKRKISVQSSLQRPDSSDLKKLRWSEKTKTECFPKIVNG